MVDKIIQLLTDTLRLGYLDENDIAEVKRLVSLASQKAIEYVILRSANAPKEKLDIVLGDVVTAVTNVQLIIDASFKKWGVSVSKKVIKYIAGLLLVSNTRWTSGE